MQETPSLIPGLGRSAGEGIGYSLQSSWASSVAQLVKNPPAMWETWVQSLDWGDPLEKGKAMDCEVHGVARTRIRLSDLYSLTTSFYCHIYLKCLSTQSEIQVS